MNYKISSGILAATTVLFATAFIISLIMLNKKPDFPNFPQGNFQAEDFMNNGPLNRPSFGEGEFPAGIPGQKPSEVESEI